MSASLSIPAAAQRDPAAIHLASLWIAEQGLHCSLKVGLYAGRQDVQEPQAWGTILADLVRHIAGALVTSGNAQESREDVVNRIWTAFHEELSKPAVPNPGAVINDGHQS